MQGVQHGRLTGRDDAPVEVYAFTAGLVARARRGDVDAFADLYRQYVERVYDYAARRLDGRHEAEEATQEVFYRAFRGLASCRDDASFAGWLFGIARFVIADVHRSRRRRHDPLDVAIDPEDPEPLPEEHVLRSEREDELRAVREHCLSPAERDLFDLLLADLTDREIAAALGRRHGAIRTAHWRLLAKLRACFGVGKGGHLVAS